jgi:hypothetical protein
MEVESVQEMIDELKEESDKDLCDIFCSGEANDFRDTVINAFVDIIEKKKSAELQELILLLNKNDIKVKDIDDQVKVEADLFPRSLLFYTLEKDKDDLDKDTIKMLKKHKFKFNYELHPSRPEDSLSLIKKAKKNYINIFGTKRKTKSKKSKRKSKKN